VNCIELAREKFSELAKEIYTVCNYGLFLAVHSKYSTCFLFYSHQLRYGIHKVFSFLYAFFMC
jgi:hypothetical protein